MPRAGPWEGGLWDEGRGRSALSVDRPPLFSSGWRNLVPAHQDSTARRHNAQLDHRPQGPAAAAGRLHARAHAVQDGRVARDRLRRHAPACPPPAALRPAWPCLSGHQRRAGAAGPRREDKDRGHGPRGRRRRGLPADYPIVAGISAQSTRETILCAREAAEAGANFGLLLPPSYWAKAVTPDAMLAYYREVADASPIPIVIYNFPGVTGGIDVDSDQIAALAEHPNIVAAKLTCGNIGKVVRLASKFSPAQFGVYGGSADYLVPTLEGGGVGCVTGMGNVFPRATARVYDLWRDGKKDEAKKLQELVGNAEWACKKGLALTKFAAWHFIGRKHLGIEERGTFAPRKPYLEPGEAMREWTVGTMQVLEEAEEAIPLRNFK
ncbi:dihydrodipicolinate synthase [Magnaporthiopsis poae ATCC 64411]|uniref:Dihydrodipicolinate synthase n=1 Tax=Magnaporthiopsis poae (strain ATCC 64411 / 73-15) TaxID=644358 RepID=A0A0C4EB22_MAGP6|nr:dihydrodipicolinate synthase [Magnaporthiopsis poae ATCC 64411]